MAHRRPRLGATCILALLAAGCGSSSEPDPRPPRSPEAQFDALWDDFDRTYPYFDLKGVDWPAARLAFRPRAAAARSEEELAGVLLETLAPLRDMHVGLRSQTGQWHPSYAPAVFRNFDAGVAAAYAARWGARAEGTWGHAMIGQVPYIYVASWASPLEGFDAFLEGVRGAPGMVIDVRMNGGGNNQYALQVVSRLTDGERIAGYVRYRGGPGHSDFTAPVALTVAPAGPWQFTRPILLLVGSGSLSSSEDFASAMRELPHVTLAGDPTGGSTANPVSRPLEAGWTYTVSRWFFTTPDGIVVEGQGIPPHVQVPSTAADFAAGIDPVLDHAERWAAAPTVRSPPVRGVFSQALQARRAGARRRVVPEANAREE